MHVLQSLWSKGFKHVVETSKTFWNFCIWSNDIFPRFYFVSSFYHQKLDAKGVKSFGLCSLVQKLLMMWPKTFGFLVKNIRVQKLLVLGSLVFGSNALVQKLLVIWLVNFGSFENNLFFGLRLWPESLCSQKIGIKSLWSMSR